MGQVRHQSGPVLQGGLVAVNDKEGKVSAGLRVDEHGGRVDVFGKDEKSATWLGIDDENGGMVGVRGMDGKLKASVSADVDGGLVSAFGKNGHSVAIGATEHSGYVGVLGKNGKMTTWLGADENGGLVSVWDKDRKLGGASRYW